MKIKIPQGKKLVSVDLETGEYILEDIKVNIREQIKTIHDIYRLNGTTEDLFKQEYGHLPKHVQGYILETMIAKAYNEGRKTIFNGKNNNYIAWWNINNKTKKFTLDDCDYFTSNALCSAHLFFNGDNAKENCVDAAEKFKDIYKLSRQ